MKSLVAGLVQLGLAGSCLLWSGCGGGSDVPDPDSDSNAASDIAPAGSGGPPPVVAEAATEEAPAAAETPEPAAADPRMKGIKAAAPAGGDSAVASTDEAAPEATTAEGEATADAAPATAEGGTPTNPDSTSSTNEMLALANSTAPSDAPAEEKAEGGGAAGGAPGMMSPGGTPSNYPGMPGAAGGRQATQAGMRAPGMAGAGGPGMAPGMAPGMPGAAGGSGARPGSNTPASFRSPADGVTSFLNALEAKDMSQLAEATSPHAIRDAKAKNQKMFSEILEESISQEDLDDLAKRLEGYRVSGENPPLSTGQITVIVEKNEDGNPYRRLINMRREKAGWKVQDIGGEADLNNARARTKRR